MYTQSVYTYLFKSFSFRICMVASNPSEDPKEKFFRNNWEDYAIISASESYRIVQAEGTALAQLGFKAEELVGMPLGGLLFEEDALTWRNNLKYADRGVYFSIAFATKNRNGEGTPLLRHYKLSLKHKSRTNTLWIKREDRRYSFGSPELIILAGEEERAIAQLEDLAHVQKPTAMDLRLYTGKKLSPDLMNKIGRAFPNENAGFLSVPDLDDESYTLLRCLDWTFKCSCPDARRIVSPLGIYPPTIRHEEKGVVFGKPLKE